MVFVTSKYVQIEHGYRGGGRHGEITVRVYPEIPIWHNFSPDLQQMTVAVHSSWLGIEAKCGRKNQAEKQGNTSL